MNSIRWIGSHIQMLLGSNDINIFTVVHYFAEEWYVLKWKDSEILLLNIITQDEFGLQIESTLSKDSSDISTVLKVWLYLFEDFDLCLSWWANQYNLRSGYDVFSVLWASVDFSFHISFMFPCWFLSVGFNFWCPHFGSSRENVDSILRVLMSNDCHCAMCKVTSSGNCNLEYGLHSILLYNLNSD